MGKLNDSERLMDDVIENEYIIKPKRIKVILYFKQCYI